MRLLLRSVTYCLKISIIISKTKHLAITALEFKLLDKLISHPRQVFSREQLLAAQNHQDAIYARNVDSHIKAIRNKLRAVSAPECIHTKRGFGYYYEST